MRTATMTLMSLLIFSALTADEDSDATMLKR